MSNTIVIVKKDGNVRGSVKFFMHADNTSEEEAEELKKFTASVERMNDDDQ